ncbi:class F sortase, partial [Amycolatopsis sp. SID8362]|nr:class F sortase [Amycolatopsis sp. SID8362]NED49270.1 class F sortase [Amycolatopsis sp. SID8362]
MTERPERRSEFARPAAAVLAVVAGLGCVLLGVTAVLAPAA